MKVQKVLAIAVALMVLAPTIAQAEWNFTWYVNDASGTNLVWNDLGVGNPLAEGNAVYLVSTGPNGTADGLNADGTFVDPGEYVVVLWGGGDTTGQIGLVDNFLPPPLDIGAGEFEYTSNIDDTQLLDPTVYVISFDVAASYLGAGIGFSPTTSGNYGMSATTYTITGPNQSSTFGTWSTDQPIVPEPATIALMIAGLGGVAAYRKKRQAA